jgi:hypothetical protein
LPALALWLWILWLYARTLWRRLKIQDSRFKIQNSKFEISNSGSASEISNSEFQISDKELHSAFRIPHSVIEKGILLGCFGGLIGFFTSGLVHYNLGDQEVAMIFFLLMGLANAKRL